MILIIAFAGRNDQFYAGVERRPDLEWRFWARYDAEFNMLNEGKLKGCLACHGTVIDNDFIFTGKVK